MKYFGDKFPWTRAINDANKSKFGHEGFRLNQHAIINAVMDDRDVFVTMPTGGGKSLTYQLPALCSEGLTVVVEPLLSLIEDQVMWLQTIDVECGFLSSTQSEQDSKNIYRGKFHN
jgi:superfamily II DNA helicase RecQ